MKIAAASIALAILVSGSGFCCYSGLLVIPTASTVGEGVYSCELQTDGVVQGLARHLTLINNEIGIGERTELGFDVDLDNSDSRLIGNAKYVAFGSGSTPVAVAFGVASVANHVRPTPYAVATAGGEGKTHLHLGSMRIDGSNRLIAGLDRHCAGGLTLMGDYTSGDDGVSSLGFNYQASGTFGVMAGALFPNDGGRTCFTLHLVWCLPFGKG